MRGRTVAVLVLGAPCQVRGGIWAGGWHGSVDERAEQKGAALGTDPCFSSLALATV